MRATFVVKRGGSWNNTPRNCRAANRNRNAPENRNNNLGGVAPASSRDQSVLTAPDALLDSTAPASDTAPAFMAADAAPMRAAVAKLRGVVTATTTVLNQTVDATGAFLVRTSR